ncbi:MAG: ArsR family transcriptional regulator [Acidobacteria bacterium]|nr:ArsR family transcriptional regulator [Acidobacteriota bacterium]
MADATRISVQDAQRHVRESDALLVCAYEDENKCRRIMLDGALSLAQFQDRLPSLPKDQEIIFYCA